eukprot:gene61-87_t
MSPSIGSACCLIYSISRNCIGSLKGTLIQVLSLLTMYIPFNQLSEKAFVWIYQSNRLINTSEEKAILEQAKAFLATWSSHGRPLQTSTTIMHGYFLIVGIEKPTFELTCCTTDSVVQFLHRIQETMHINFFHRTQIVLAKDDQYWSLNVQEAKEQWKDQKLADHTYTFDHTIKQKGELSTRWKIPVHQAWAILEKRKQAMKGRYKR